MEPEEAVSSPKAPSRLKYFLAAFSAAALWGFMSIPLRELQPWPSEDILYYRILVSLVFIWAFIFIFRRKQFFSDVNHYKALSKIERPRLNLLLITSTILILGNWFSFIYVVNHVSIQVAAFAYLVCPLLTTLAAFMLLKEELTRIKKISLFIALTSVMLLARGSLLDVLWSIGVALLYALYLIIQRITKHVDKLNVLALQLSISTIIILPALFWQHHAIPVEPTFWLNTIIIAIVFTIIPLYLSMWALNGISSSTVGILIYINPIVAFAVAVLYFGESIDAHKFWAYSILFFAIILFNWNVIAPLVKSRKKQPQS